MGIDSAKKGCWIYHLTKLKHLDSIIEYGLASRRLLIQNGVIFEDVADPGIMSKRTLLGLDKYIPFHFHPYSSFDVAVKSTYYKDDFMYICVNRELARQNKFKILPKHPLTIEECNVYEYDEGFDLIDWDTLTQKGLDDDYSKHVKMAECITELMVPIDCFQSIAVKNDDIKQKVEAKLIEKNANFPASHVNVRPYWF